MKLLMQRMSIFRLDSELDFATTHDHHDHRVPVAAAWHLCFFLSRSPLRSYVYFIDSHDVFLPMNPVATFYEFIVIHLFYQVSLGLADALADKIVQFFKGVAAQLNYIIKQQHSYTFAFEFQL